MLTIDVGLRDRNINRAVNLRLREGLDVLDLRIVIHFVGRVFARGVVC